MIELLLAASACQVNSSWRILREPPFAQQVRLELSTDRTTYVVGEPLQFHLAVRNITDRPVRGDFKIFLTATSPKVLLQYRRDPSGAFSPFLTQGGHGIPVSPAEIEPGAVFSSGDESLAVDRVRHQLILARPGAHEFKATYCDGPGDLNSIVESNTEAVVVEPAPDAHRDAFEAYAKLNHSLAEWPVRYTNVTSDEAIAAFDFLERYPDSPWTRPIRKGLLPTVASRVLHGKASPEEAERVRLISEREAAERSAGP